VLVRGIDRLSGPACGIMAADGALSRGATPAHRPVRPGTRQKEEPVHEIAGFLRGFPPFEGASDAVLDDVVASTEIEFFHQGAWILRAGEANDGFAHVVRTGHVELIDSGRVIDVIGPGDLVGLPSLVSDLPPGLDVRAAEDVLAYRIPADAFLPLLAGRSGLRFLARTVRERTPALPAEQLTETAVEQVGSLVRTAVVVAPGTPIGDVVRGMRDAGA
jgi:CBS domain-containing protein